MNWYLNGNILTPFILTGIRYLNISYFNLHDYIIIVALQIIIIFWKTILIFHMYVQQAYTLELTHTLRHEMCQVISKQQWPQNNTSSIQKIEIKLHTGKQRGTKIVIREIYKLIIYCRVDYLQRAELTDFDRFKLRYARRMRNKIRSRVFHKLKATRGGRPKGAKGEKKAKAPKKAAPKKK